MGIRIRKRLGYGYVTKSDAAVTTTDMLNTDSFLLKEENFPFKDSEEALKDYLDFARKWETEHEDRQPLLTDHIFLAEQAKKSPVSPHWYLDLYRLVGHSGSEGGSGDNDVFVLTPLGMVKEWYRFDDIIDHIEDMEFAQNYELKEDVRVLFNGIFPYSGTYMRADTLERVDHRIMSWIRAVNDGNTYEQNMDELARFGGFTSHEEAQSLVVPKPCDDAVVLAHWAQVFKNPQDAYRMQPLYYKHWS